MVNERSDHYKSINEMKSLLFEVNLSTEALNYVAQKNNKSLEVMLSEHNGLSSEGITQSRALPKWLLVLVVTLNTVVITGHRKEGH